MVIQKILKKQEGFSLILLIVFFSVIGVIAVTAVNLNLKIQKISQGSKTVNRVNVVRDALVEHYKGHQELPVDAADRNKIPVGALGLEQKYRLDAWGQYYYYHRIQERKESDSLAVPPEPPGELATHIRGLTVDLTGQKAAGIIVSAGPNQVFDSFDPTSPPVKYPDTDNGYSEKGDDIYVPVNVQAEAINIAYSTLHSLARKVCAYIYAPGNINHLRGMEFSIPPDRTPGGAVKHFSSWFALGDTYRHDPWLNFYLFDKNEVEFRSYFSSAGPDGTPGNADDLIVPIFCTYPGDSSISSPVAIYPFDEGTGQIAHDKTIYGQDGTLKNMDVGGVNDPWLSTAEAVMGDSALRFDGDNDYVSVPVLAGSPLDITDTLTLMAWVRQSVQSGNRQVISRRSGSYFYFLGVDEGEPYGGIGNHLIEQGQVTPRPGEPGTRMPSVDLGKWYHLAFVYNDANDLMYMVVNGIKKTDEFVAISLPSRVGIPLTIGADSGGMDGFFHGAIDEVAIYAQDLSIKDIRKIYNKPFRGKGGVACYPFNSESNPGVTTNDESGNGNHGTINGAVQVPTNRSQNHGNSSGAYTFNGAEYIDCGDDSSLQIKEFTIACWVKADAAPGNSNISQIIAGGTAGNNYVLSWDHIDSDFQQSIAFKNTLGDWEKAQIPPLTTTLSANQWYHIAGTYDGTDLTIYIYDPSGGVLTSSFSQPVSTTPLTNSEKTFVGAAPHTSGTGAQSFFNGTIDEVVIYNRALTSVEIEQLRIACPCIN